MMRHASRNALLIRDRSAEVSLRSDLSFSRMRSGTITRSKIEQKRSAASVCCSVADGVEVDERSCVVDVEVMAGFA